MFRKIHKLIIFLSLAVIYFAAAHFALAAVDIWGGQQAAIGNALGLSDTEDPRVLAANIIRIALGFLGIIAIVIIIYGGWTWMTAGGDAQKIDKAKKILISAVIGLILILASFGIASFVLQELSGVIGGGGGCDPPCDIAGGECCISEVCQPCPVVGPVVNTFFVNSTAPANGSANVIRNIKVKFTFNTSVNSGTVSPGAAGTFQVIDGAGAEIPGATAVESSRIVFTPDAACPVNPCGAVNCLPENESITVTAVNGAGGILSVGGLELTCAGFGPCAITFATGDQIDCQDPEAGLIFNQVCADEGNEIYGWATDDSGVDNIEFFISGVSIIDPGNPVINPLADSPFNTFDEGMPVIFDGSGYMPGEPITLRADAEDLAGNSASKSQTTTMRPAHCCNGALDGPGDPDLIDPAKPEQGIDCGGECAACVGAACGDDLASDCGALGIDCHSNDDKCASVFCDCSGDADSCADAGYGIGVANCCLCQVKPVIYWLAPAGGFCDGAVNTSCQSDGDCAAFSPNTCDTDTANGAIGNLVTIGGKNFGDNPGEIYFSDGAGGWIQADLADSVNPQCDSVWQDNQIIAVAPAGAASGPVKVKTAVNNYEDSTNDGYGPIVDDFIVNTIIRPGLCKLDPNNGAMNDSINYYGIKLAGASAYFGKTTQYVAALNSNFAVDLQGSGQVPNIQTGKTTSFVIKNNINSNYLIFIKDEEPVTGPYITSFEPTKGKEGQYVTIFGSGFGVDKGTSGVYFGGVEADYNFPDVCADSFWSDNQVIVKVPAGAADGNYAISMEIGSWTINTNNLSPNSFNIDGSLALAPGLCKLSPLTGANNSPVTLWGEYFGAQATGLARFHFNRDQSGAAITFWGPDGDADKIETTVHQDGVSGPVLVVQAGIAGNGINFNVGACAKDIDCGAGNVCCPVGSYKEGGCELEGAEKYENCYVTVSSSVYEWDFSTAAKVPCDSNSATLECEPDDSLCKNLGFDFCDAAAGCVCADKPSVESCMGYGSGQCSNNLCPNSPGQCSYYTGGNPAVIGSCDPSCNNILVCNKNLIAHWDFEDGAGSNILTDQVNGYNGALINMDPNTDWVAGKVGTALDFDGVNDYITVPDNPGLNFGANQSFAVEAWVYSDPEASNQDLMSRIVNKWACNSGGVTQRGWLLDVNAQDNGGDPIPGPGYIRFKALDSNGTIVSYSADGGFTPNIWYHIYVSIDRTNDILRFFVNGVQKGGDFNISALTGSISTPGIPLAIGYIPCQAEIPWYYHNGLIDEVKIYNISLCSYNSGLDRCVLTGAGCSLPKTAQDALGKNITAYCALYNGAGRWQISTSLSCPAGWTNIGGGKCIEDGTVCDICSAGFVCSDDYDFDGGGVCAVNQDICPADAVCSATDECVKNDEAVCECCCRIANAAQDCCAPLDCTGNCGSDAVGPDTDTYGYCTGCADAGATQAEHDAACNCSGSSGKFCDTGDSEYPSGVCRDCAQLSIAPQCLLHSTTCCIDAMAGNNCRGGGGNLLLGGFCAYYDCQAPPNDDQCDNLNPLASGAYRDIPVCQTGCAESGGIIGGLSCYNSGTEVCDLVCGAGYTCLGDTGCVDNLGPPTGCVAGDESCLCCCDPANDQCALINENLSCMPDKEPCAGAARGLCCGCTADSECGNPAGVGCGFDSCCHGRPEVDSNYPADEAIDICRNTIITVGFDQKMDINSFSGNILVFGDYGISPCPAGTEYLTFKKDYIGPWAARLADRIIDFLARTPLIKKLFPQRANALIGNFCAISGKVSGYNNAAGAGTLVFSSNQLLDADRIYYVIIKGDGNINDTTNEGVLSYYKVGMNGLSTETFNARAYANAHIWSFKTGSEICQLSYITIDPASHLFQSAGAEQDFQAYPRSANEQNLANIPGAYNWKWSWASDSEAVAKVTNSDNSLQTVTSQNIKDGKTYIKATATITEDNIIIPSTVGQSKTGKATVYVFLCENPWPPVPLSGVWQPWIDNNANCSIIDNGCFDTSYEVYYCRDAAGAGTADDLPPVLSGVDDSVIRGKSNEKNILKEFYFFRENAPAGAVNLTAVDDGTGGSVTISWPAVADSAVIGYKLYYGAKSGDYDNYKDVGNILSYTLTGLTNNEIYYFNLTSYYNTTAESDYYGEVEVAPTDSTAPAPPANLAAVAGNKEVNLSWDANTDDTVSYKVYYGTTHAIYGKIIDVGEDTTATITDLSSESAFYYFTVSAVDAYGNESAKANELIALVGEQSGIFQNALTNVDFEQGVVGSMPTDWSKIAQKHSCVGISQNEAISGNQSILFHQDPNQAYPGVCNQTNCNDCGGGVGVCGGTCWSSICTWLPGTNQCKFPQADMCKPVAPAIYNENEILCFGNTHRVMFVSLKYNVAPLAWQVGKTYLVAFFYKGNLGFKATINLSYNSGGTAQCVPKAIPFIDADGNCKSGSDCSEQPNTCCIQAPIQTKCYQAVNFPSISAGDYNNGPYDGWNLYLTTFEYTEAVSKLLDKFGNLRNEVAITIGYGSTGAQGTDLYVDNFIVAEAAQ